MNSLIVIVLHIQIGFKHCVFHGLYWKCWLLMLYDIPNGLIGMRWDSVLEPHLPVIVNCLPLRMTEFVSEAVIGKLHCKRHINTSVSSSTVCDKTLTTCQKWM